MDRLFIIFAFASMWAAGSPLTRAEEALAVVVNKANGVENLTLPELRKLCLGESNRWDGGKRVTVVLRDPGQEERAAVLRQVYGMSEDELARHFPQGESSKRMQFAPKKLSTAGGVQRFIFNVPGAIGFVRVSEVASSVKTVRVNGCSPGDADYPLKLAAR
ncbi:MAG: hypothetical protein K1X78_17210 [Verrucomicrobiaceae bacterium]|nr:hypothetical protein [Verrucomicrobiaceae bacterium]